MPDMVLTLTYWEIKQKTAKITNRKEFGLSPLENIPLF
jgi:hypothetical protein